MLGYNCLIQNTQLYKDLSAFVKKIMLQRVADGKPVAIEDVYREARASHFLDVDMNSVGEMYKDARAEIELKVGKGILDTDNQIGKKTDKLIHEAIRRVISNRRKTEMKEVGVEKPSQSVARDIVNLFENDFVGLKDTVNKTDMLQMQEAIKKVAVALVDKQGKKTQNKSFEEILKEALRLDELGVKDLNGRLNSMDDLFNQVSEEIDKVVQKMELAKKGMPKFKQDEIDQKIQKFKEYTKNIEQGAYTLALSRAEQQKVLRDILKEKYGKTIVSNGQKKTVLDWNKMFTGAQDFKQDVSAILASKGFTPQQIDKITNALKFQFDALKSTSQWNNASLRSQQQAVNDDKFLSRAAAEVVMSKQDKNGEYYRKFNATTQRYEPDWDRWENDKGQTINQLKDSIKNDIEKNGSASEYRQIVSELARKNNPAKHISKGDLEKLSEVAQRHGFDATFNAKTYNMLGLSEEDAAAGKMLEDLSKKVKQVLDKGGKQSRIAMSKILDDMNDIMARTHGSRSGLLHFARNFEWWMGNRNAFRLLNYLNVMENNLSGANQLIQTSFQSMSKEAAKKEFKKLLPIILDVGGGGKHFDMTDVDKLSYQAHDYRFDETKSMEHNIKAALNFLPNLALGVMDSAAHAYTMRIMFYNSAVLTNLSKLKKDKVDDYISKGYSEKDAKNLVNKESDDLKKKAIENVSNALYDPTAEKQAYEQAAEVLKLVTPNPTESQIQREADNLMLQNIVTKGILNQNQFEALLNASDLSAKKAIGKEAAVNALGETLTSANRNSRAKIKKSIQEGKLSKAAGLIIGNAIVMKGIFPFLSGAANWGVIALKKTPLGLLRAIPYNKKSFKEQIEMASELDPKKLGEIMESYNSRRNDIYFSLQGMVWFTMIAAAMAGMKVIGGDDDEDMVEWANNQIQEAAEKDGRVKRIIKRWMPPTAQIYNILAGNLKSGDSKINNTIDDLSQFTGFGILENPITKATKYTSKKHQGAGVGSLIGGIFDVGAYYNALNSYADLFGEEQTDKPKSHSTYLGDAAGVPDNDFINGIISGMMGYNLHQDINSWTGFEPSK